MFLKLQDSKEKKNLKSRTPQVSCGAEWAQVQYHQYLQGFLVFFSPSVFMQTRLSKNITETYYSSSKTDYARFKVYQTNVAL